MFGLFGARAFEGFSQNRPPKVSQWGNILTWFKGCSANGINDGTIYDIDWFNFVSATLAKCVQQELTPAEITAILAANVGSNEEPEDYLLAACFKKSRDRIDALEQALAALIPTPGGVDP